MSISEIAAADGVVDEHGELDPSTHDARLLRYNETRSFGMQLSCPRCRLYRIEPSRSTGSLDWFFRVFGFKPYRCLSCGRRFFRSWKSQKSSIKPGSTEAP